MYKIANNLVCFFAFLFLICGCGGVKKAKKELIYFNEGTLDTLPNLTVNEESIPIQANDILSITVYSASTEASAIYNRGSSLQASMANQTTGNPLGGYMVDRDGYIRFQSLGKVKAAGVTRLQLMDTMSVMLQKYLTDPSVDIRFINIRATVLGEVQKPGVFVLPKDRISILELIGMAGDFTIYGQKKNVLIIRQVDGMRKFGRIDLGKADAFQSPYFYIQPNDMVVIEPNNKKPTATEQENMRKLTMITAAATLVSTLSILITLFRK